MRYLLDTHTLLWAVDGSKKLPNHLKDTISDKSNLCFVSIASIWEISIKFSLGRLKIISDLDEYLPLVKRSGFEILPIEENHLLRLPNLPFHHKDPFDRLIIAQAQTEQFTLISKDSKFEEYDVSLLWNT